MTFGEQGDTFYIMLEGDCSVWVPMLHKQAHIVILKYFTEMVIGDSDIQSSFKLFLNDGTMQSELKYNQQNPGAKVSYA